MSSIRLESMHRQSFLNRLCIDTTSPAKIQIAHHIFSRYSKKSPFRALFTASCHHRTLWKFVFHGVRCSERSPVVAGWCTTQERIHSNTKWQSKTSQNSNLVTKMKKWTDINVSMHQKDIFWLSNRKKVPFLWNPKCIVSCHVTYYLNNTHAYFTKFN